MLGPLVRGSSPPGNPDSLKGEGAHTCRVFQELRFRPAPRMVFDKDLGDSLPGPVWQPTNDQTTYIRAVRA